MAAPARLEPYHLLLANDAYAGNYTALNRVFRAESEFVGDTIPQPADILIHQVAASFEARTVFMVLCDDGQTETFHRITQYRPLLGRPCDLDNRYFAFVGDQDEAGIIVVEVTAAVFNRSNSIRVLTTAQTALDLAADPDVEGFGPHQDDDANTMSRRVRSAALVPPRYVAHVLARRFTPRQLWEQVAKPIIADGNAEACAPFLSWCHVALTRTANAGPPVTQIQRLPQRSIGTSPELRFFVGRLLQVDVANTLYQYQNSPQPGAPPPVPGVDAIAYLAARDADQALRAAAADTLEALFQSRIISLLRVARATCENDLRPFWREFVRAKKSDRRLVLERYVRAAWEINPFGLEGPPLITPDYAKDIYEFKWHDDGI